MFIYQLKWSNTLENVKNLKICNQGSKKKKVKTLNVQTQHQTTIFGESESACCLWTLVSMLVGTSPRFSVVTAAPTESSR